MIEIKFLEAQEVKDGEGIVIEKWRAGQVVELNNASARFWLSRGLALDVRAAAREAREARLLAAEKPPGWDVIKAAPADAKEPEAIEKKPEVASGVVNPTSPKSGKAKRPYVRRQAPV